MIGFIPPPHLKMLLCIILLHFIACYLCCIVVDFAMLMCYFATKLVSQVSIIGPQMAGSLLLLTKPLRAGAQRMTAAQGFGLQPAIVV